MNNPLLANTSTQLQHYCLICRINYSNEYHPENSAKTVLLTKLFNNLCKYMGWKPCERSTYDFEKELFPLCKNCQETVCQLYRLDEQLEEIRKNIDQIVANLSVKIINSRAESPRKTGLKDEDDDDKARFYRNAVFKRFSAQVNLKVTADLSTISTKDKLLSKSKFEVVEEKFRPAETDTAQIQWSGDINFASGSNTFEDVANVGLSYFCEPLLGDDSYEDNLPNYSNYVSKSPSTNDPATLELKLSVKSLPEPDTEKKSTRAAARAVTSYDDGTMDGSPSMSITSSDESEGQGSNFEDLDEESDEFPERVRSIRRRKKPRRRIIDSDSEIDDSTSAVTNPKRSAIEEVSPGRFVIGEKWFFEKLGDDFMCVACKRCSNSVDRIKKHINTQHVNKRDHECNLCDKIFSRADGLKRHHQVCHTAPDDQTALKYTCEICGEAFRRVDYVRRHQLSHHNKDKQSPPFNCEECGKSFKTMGACTTHKLNKHSAVTPDAPTVPNYTCDICGETLTCDEALDEHYHSLHPWASREVQNRRNCTHYPYMCETCGKSFKTKTTLRDHKTNVHADESDLKYPCEECGKKFAEARTLKKHLTTHQRVVCYICGLELSRTHIKSHLSTHSEEKSFNCWKCTKSFRNVRDLSRHVKYHDGLKPFSCDICGGKFSRRDNLKAHTNNVHNPN